MLRSCPWHIKAPLVALLDVWDTHFLVAFGLEECADSHAGYGLIYVKEAGAD